MRKNRVSLLLIVILLFTLIFSTSIQAIVLTLNATTATTTPLNLWAQVSEANLGVHDQSTFSATRTGVAYETTKRDVLHANFANYSGSGTINNVTLIVWAASDVAAASEGITLQIYLGGSAYPGAPATYATSTSFQQFTYIWTLSPATGIAWTWSEINSTISNIDTIVSGRQDITEWQVDAMWLQVDYSPPDLVAPNVSLGKPDNNTFWLNNLLNVNFTAIDNSLIANCTLILNDTRNETILNVLNNTETNISTTITDGVWSWTVNCTDENNNEGTNFTKKIVKVDTQPPQIKLELPGNNTDWTVSPSVFFEFNVTDRMTTISSCELIVDGQEKDTFSSPQEGIALNTSVSLANGQHNWSVNCTDSNGFENSSLVYNLTVNFFGPAVSTNFPNYEQGGQVNISGANWNPTVTVTLRLNWSNGTIELWNETTSASGDFNSTYSLAFNQPTGSYELYAYEFGNEADNATTTFNVNTRPSGVNVQNSYFQGEFALITGYGFSPFNNVTIDIVYPLGQNITNLTANSTGGIVYVFPIGYSAILGLYNVSVFDILYSNLNGTDNFTVNNRVATLSTDQTDYLPYENVTITGQWYTVNGTLSLTIRDEDSLELAPGFPITVYANSTGGFVIDWNATDTCFGNFSVMAEDQNHTELNATSYFNITEVIAYDNTLAYAISEGDGQGTTLSNVLTPGDSNYETLALTNGQTDYLQANFSYSLPLTTDVKTARVWVQHYVGTKINFDHFEWRNDSTWQTVSCAITSPVSNTLEYCDLDFLNASQVNSLDIRIFYYREPGGNDAYVDWFQFNISYGGGGTCTEWGDLSPSVESVLFDDFFAPVPNEIDLLAGILTPVYCNASVYKFSGAANIDSANATIYYYLNKSNDADDNNTHYTQTSCAEAGSAGNYKNFTCDFNVTYYVNNGTWWCNVTALDTGGYTDSLIDNVTINAFYAINITPLIDFDDVELMQTSPDVIATVNNFGNSQIDLQLDAYAVNDNDGYAMNCTENNISYSGERYSLSSGQPFISMTQVSDSPVTLSTFDLVKQTNATPSTRNVYWKLQPNNQARGNCTGIVVFTATAS
ncbi:hypothetical protein GOV04_03095 [Candidatus Woesearchaeota archaeon]|nr:hypothetical protein [Candidatus Woesearchaeota archaeon]